MNKPLSGFLKVILMRDRKDAVSLILLAVTSFLVYKHCLTDMSFCAVVSAIAAHSYLSHKEKMQLPPDRGSL